MKSNNCNLCNSLNLKTVIDLGYHPCADTFISNFNNDHGSEKTYPLRGCLCGDCGHTQLTNIVPGHERYQDTEYSYDSSNSVVSIEHFKEMARQVSDEMCLTESDLVCDIGSNIGTLLESFKTYAGCNIIGIDPASNICDIANKNGVPTINDFFSINSSKKVLMQGKPKVLTATNALNHSEDVDNFFNLAKDLIDDDGVIVVEVPYLLELLEQKAFDTIYLEHVNYFSVAPLASYLSKIDMCIARIEVKEYMCGSLRMYIKKGDRMCDEAIELIDKENRFGLRDGEVYSNFMNVLKELKFNLNTQLNKIKLNGGVIFGIGAATKGNTLLNYCNIDSDLVDFISDSSELKVGKYTPGSHIKIINDEDIPNHVTHGLILPWNIADYLKNKLKYLDIDFITPILEKNK